MAHPGRIALDRKALTVGLTAALLALPMAGMGSATTLEDDLTGGTQEALAEAEALEDSLQTAVTDTLGDDAVEDVVKRVTDPEPVADVVEEAPEAEEVAPAPPAPPVEETPSDPGSGGDREAGAAGDNVQPVTPPEQTATPAESTAPAGSTAPAAGSGTQAATAPALRNDLRTTSGFRSSSDRPALQPAPAPLVSSPFAAQAPRISGDAAQTPLTALSAAPSAVAEAFEAVTATPLSSEPAGVPGALTATAAGLLLMVGAAHLLHRNGSLSRTFAR